MIERKMLAAYEPCRNCGASLRRADHLTLPGDETAIARLHDERRLRPATGLVPLRRHTPCPTCGDPRPLWSWRRRLSRIAVRVAFVSIWGGAIYLFFS